MNVAILRAGFDRSRSWSRVCSAFGSRKET